ncbi:hypothetical protein NDU88_003309 [Pleurodeles waltl]|uniref:Uncharacterized protein n=1 Tax=Pleurodeles waltl TaxID=8319 RepID=A0AAV7M8F2_PLEWA|nr:hypothetical protein NDU88_003309 [Pleurodeles waltl]
MCHVGAGEETGADLIAGEPSKAELLAPIHGSRAALEGKIELVALEVNLLRADHRKVSERVQITEGSISKLRDEVTTLWKQMAEVTSRAGNLETREDVRRWLEVWVKVPREGAGSWWKGDGTTCEACNSNSRSRESSSGGEESPTRVEMQEEGTMAPMHWDAVPVSMGPGTAVEADTNLNDSAT